MRRLLAFAFVAALVGASCSSGSPGSEAALPSFSAPVVDAAGVIPDDVEQQLDADLEGFRTRIDKQIAVATVKTTGDRSLEDYTIDLARKWGVGEKGEDDGVLLLIAVDDRDVRIEVGGGAEGDITDAEAGRIVDQQLLPQLRDGNYGDAVLGAVHELRRQLGDTELGAAPVTTAPNQDPGGGGLPILPLIFGGLFLLSAFGAGGRRRRNRWGLGGPIIWGGGFGGGGGGFGGGGGGGFGGGGGGGFSGGGSSGSW